MTENLIPHVKDEEYQSEAEDNAEQKNPLADFHELQQQAHQIENEAAFVHDASELLRFGINTVSQRYGLDKTISTISDLGKPMRDNYPNKSLVTEFFNTIEPDATERKALFDQIIQDHQTRGGGGLNADTDYAGASNNVVESYLWFDDKHREVRERRALSGDGVFAKRLDSAFNNALYKTDNLLDGGKGLDTDFWALEGEKDAVQQSKFEQLATLGGGSDLLSLFKGCDIHIGDKSNELLDNVSRFDTQYKEKLDGISKEEADMLDIKMSVLSGEKASLEQMFEAATSDTQRDFIQTRLDALVEASNAEESATQVAIDARQQSIKEYYDVNSISANSRKKLAHNIYRADRFRQEQEQEEQS